MAPPPTLRAAAAEDEAAWRRLWRGYCESLDATLPDEVTSGVWQRILDPASPLHCLVARGEDGSPIGFANYVLRPHTWSLRLACYLEDLFVAPEARGTGAGRALIEGLVALGRQRNWRRVYWHTHEDNYRARTLYDRVTPRTDYVRYDIDL